MKPMNIARKYGAQLAVVAAGALATLASAQAAIDVTAATGGISDAQTALLSVLTALIGLSAAIFGVVKVYQFLKRRAGA